MTEHPILFSGEMVRAILEGRKTQTRRVMKPQLVVDGKRHRKWEVADVLARCPYGQPGHRLWVRETWTAQFTNDNDHVLWWHNTPKEQRTYNRLCGGIIYRASYQPEPNDEWPFVPSIFMPRWASRLTLEIVGVRVERLQDISIDDIKAKGVYPGLQASAENLAAVSIRHDGYQYMQEFKWLWDSINARRGYPWESNPWVWVVEFRRIER